MSFSLPLKTSVAALVLAGAASTAAASPEAYVLDASHSQIVFTYNHMGLSTTTTVFSGFDGELNLDQKSPANSSVEVSFPVTTMLTGWQERFDHFMSADFFNATVNTDVSFESTEIEVTGDTTANITGDLTINGITKPIVLAAVLNATMDEHPMAKKPWAGFDATATVLRSDYGMGAFVPFVSDEVAVQISIEAMKAE